jgi:iron complex transport system substrate-binding protein
MPPKSTTSDRIVCGSPAVAEIVFELGCGDRVVGVSDYMVYPPEANAKESIGGWTNPSRERRLGRKARFPNPLGKGRRG